MLVENPNFAPKICFPYTPICVVFANNYVSLEITFLRVVLRLALQVNKTEHNRTEFVLSVSNFKAEAAPITAYDISPCYGQDHKETYVLKFPGEHYESIAKNPIQFKRTRRCCASAPLC